MNDARPWTKWIDEATVAALWDEGMNRYGGLRSQQKPGCVDGSLGAAYHAEVLSMPEVDEETVTSGLVFCGYLLFYIASNHCWTDGNKRAAWSSAMWVLFRLGLTVDVPDQEAIDYCLAIAGKKIKSGEEVVIWIADRLKEL